MDFSTHISQLTGFALASFALAILANLLADPFLKRIQTEFGYTGNMPLRRLRWMCVATALPILAALHIPFSALIAVALLSITAATDLESSYLPPDAFTLGSTIICLMLSFVQSGWLGLRDAVVAQAICFAVMVFVVTFTSACDSGDIKLAMQFGAAAGSLTNVFVGVMAMWLTMMLLLVIQFVRSRSVTSLSRLRLPLGPIAWAGLVVALLWRAL